MRLYAASILIALGVGFVAGVAATRGELLTCVARPEHNFNPYGQGAVRYDD